MIDSLTIDSPIGMVCALKFVLENEGDYSNHPNDKGGETFMGISRVYHPAWDGWKIIDEAKEELSPYSIEFRDYLTKQHIYYKVNDFYKNNFWKPLMLDKIKLQRIAIKIFDMGVNLGVPRTASIVQTCLNAMSHGVDSELRVDNIIGPLTVNLINEFTKNDEGDFLLKLLTLQQGYIYMKLVQNNSTQKKFLKGWINRLGITILNK